MLLRPQSAAVSYPPALGMGVSVEFWGCGHGQRSGPVGPQAQGMSLNQGCWGCVEPSGGPLLSFAQAWLLAFCKGL